MTEKLKTIEEIDKIVSRATIIKVLPTDFDPKEEYVSCPLCDGEGVLEAQRIEFKTCWETLTEGIQAFGLGDKLTATVDLINAIPDMYKIIKNQQKIIEKNEN